MGLCKAFVDIILAAQDIALATYACLLMKKYYLDDRAEEKELE
jgi:hypothetical protein